MGGGLRDDGHLPGTRLEPAAYCTLMLSVPRLYSWFLKGQGRAPELVTYETKGVALSVESRPQRHDGHLC